MAVTIGIEDVKQQELTSIRDSYSFDHVDPATPLSALCLSGGGIRSAAFSMGVIQAFAQKKLLTKFDYLSTVSGGGYTGAWLQALIRSRDGCALHAQEALAAEANPSGALGSLRRYTNFMTPNPLFASIDTFAGLVLYLRNLLLTWAMLLPLMMAIVLLPIFGRTLVSACYGNLHLLVLANLLSFWGVVASALALPNHRLIWGTTPTYLSSSQISRLILYPFFGWLMCMTIAVDVTKGISDFPLPVLSHMGSLVLGYAVAHVIQIASRDPNHGLLLSNWPQWVIATCVSGGAIWGGMAVLDIAARWYEQTFGRPDLASIQTLLLPLWLVLATLIHTTVFVGLRRGGTAMFDLDREWLARLNGMMLRPVLFWTLLAVCVIVLPLLLLGPKSEHWQWAMQVLAPAASISPLVAWLGKKITTRAGSVAEALIEKTSIVSPLALNFAAVSAIAATIALISILIQRGVLSWLNGWFELSDNGGRMTQLGQLFPVVLLGVFLIALLVVISYQINVNRFSMHAVYRNRLTRAFLGSSRGDNRKPDPFTDFDPTDNLPLSELWSEKRQRCLFPIINMTLNITNPSRTDWAERKAMCFTVSPLHCGSAMLGEKKGGTFVPTKCYGGLESRSSKEPVSKGISLATAMTISGAAASPHWGYNSSPPIAFLMTLFNVRLGAWLPNPARVTKPMALSANFPVKAAYALIGDLLGRASDRASGIYLSDGGHFENLGVYEMLRRQCRWIIVVDASQDKACSFTDLGNAIRKAEVDLPLRVHFDQTPRIRRRDDKSPGPVPLGFALARIEYLEPERASGTLLYIKPSLLPDTPMAARVYAELNPDFPHESTLDQWFSESQFESYRALGLHQAWRLVEKANNLEDLFKCAAKKYAK